jgi:Ca2+-binding RTX toxin-like protein
MTVRAVGQVGFGSDLSNIEFDFAKYISDSASDVVYGGEGPNQIIGNRGNDTLYGRTGDDALFGGAGRDVLFGGRGADHFVFDKAANVGKVDRIKDFSYKQGDKIVLSQKAFAAVALSFDAAPKVYQHQLDKTAAQLSTFAFRYGKQALDETDRVIYDTETGSLWYDADGSGAGAAVKFAKLKAYTNLSYTDFLYY